MVVHLLHSLPFKGFHLSISPNKQKLASLSNTSINVFSLNPLLHIGQYKINHPTKVAWISDDELYVITSEGKVYLWKQEALSLIGRWDKALWSRQSVWFTQHGLITTFVNEKKQSYGIAHFDLSDSSSTEIYQCPKDKKVCLAGTKNNLAIGLMSHNSGSTSINTGSIFTLNIESGEERMAPLANKVRFSTIADPIFHDDAYITFPVLQMPPLSFRWERLITVDLFGHIIAEGDHLPDPWNPVMNNTGSQSPSNYIATDCGLDPASIALFNKNDLSLVHLIEPNQIWLRRPNNYPSSIVFSSDNELIVGTWEEILLFRIEH